MTQKRLVTSARALAATLTVLFLAASLAAPALATKRMALVIGNSAYTSQDPLKNPANDAALIGRTLKSVGFEVDQHIDLSQKKIRRAILNFTRKVEAAGKDTIAVFYYAGHGIQVKGENYLIPVDADIKGEGDVAIESVALSRVLQSMELTGAGVNIIILDACRNNPFIKKRGGGRGLARVDTPTGSIIAYSTKPGATAADGDGINSPYSLALAEMIKKPGMPVEKAFKLVRIKVLEMTNNAQVPWEDTSLLQDVSFAPASSGPATTPSTLTGPVPPVTTTPPVKSPPFQPPANTLADGKAAYQRALDQGTIAGYQLFISRFPNHPKVSVARKLLETLSDEVSWNKATRTNTIASYTRYLIAFPEGIYAGDATRRRNRMRQQAAVDPNPPPITGNSTDSGTDTSPPVFNTPDPPIIKQPEPRAALTIRHGYDAYGNDYRILKKVPYNSCVSACRSDRQCRAFTYNTSARWCFLKHAYSKLIPTRNAIAGYRRSSASAPPRVSSIRVIPNADVRGQDYSNLKRVTFQTCYKTCERSNLCRSFAYINRLRDCWLKTGRTPVLRKRGVTLGIKN